MIMLLCYYYTFILNTPSSFLFLTFLHRVVSTSPVLQVRQQTFELSKLYRSVFIQEFQVSLSSPITLNIDNWWHVGVLLGIPLVSPRVLVRVMLCLGYVVFSSTLA